MTFDSQSPKAGSFLLNVSIVAGIFALVFGPILGRYFKEHAIPRWQLAYGSNQLEKGNREAARLALDKAFEGDASIIEDYHYVQTRFELILQSEEDQSDEVTRFTNLLASSYEKRTLDADSMLGAGRNGDSRDTERMSRLTVAVASELLDRGYAAQAVRFMEKLLKPMQERGASQNNLLAYSRAVADQDLDVALLEVNLALAEFRQLDDSALLDTKAWVLHRRRENASALEYSDRAIDRIYEALASSRISELSGAMLSDQAMEGLRLGEGGELSLGSREKAIAKAREGIEKKLDAIRGMPRSEWYGLLRSIAVMRYHRVMILESLGRGEAGNADRLWLELFQFEKLDELR